MPENLIAKSAREWREAEARRKPLPGSPGHSQPEGKEPAAQMLPLVEVSSFAAIDEPPRLFLDYAELLPMRQVVLLMGDGGTGKSLLALQLAIACVTATPWLNIEVQRGGVLYVSAEEEEDEMHRRAKAICRAEGIELGQAYDLSLLSLAGLDAVLAYEKGQHRLERTPLYRNLDFTMRVVRPMVLILDNLADTFAGNENNRSLAKQFISLLRHLAIEHDCAVVLLAHPSLQGISSGSGMSGSTAWSNSVRARLYLHRPSDANADPDERILEVMKTNQGRIGTRYDLKWQDGRFVRTVPATPWSRIAVADVERVKKLFEDGRYRHSEQSNDWGGFAVADMLEFDVGRGLPTKQRSSEQERNRADIRTYLTGWVKSRTLFIVDGIGPDRKPTQFYTSTKEEEGREP